MRTTIRLDDQLLADAKRYARESGRTLTAVIEDALRQVLARRTPDRPRERVTLTTYGRGGTMPGVDLDNSAALLDLMEREE
jgi:hypothetical protein